MHENQVDPWLEGVPVKTRIEWFLSFAQLIRTGTKGRGNQVKAGSVSKALGAIGATFELAALRNPLYSDTPGTSKEYHKKLALLMGGFRHEDPTTEPQLAVPVALPHHLINMALTSKSPKTQATGHLCNIAFYYLLRVGEYAYTNKSERETLTRKFTVKDVTFRRHGRVIPNDSSLEALLQATSTTLCISNQKNGRKGQCIHHQCTRDPRYSPVKSLAHRIHHITSNGGSTDTFLSTYYPKPNRPGLRHQVNDKDITKAIRTAAKYIGLYQQGYKSKQVSSHSLRAGGAMALSLTGATKYQIMKMGRWSSDTFLMYIHEQITAIADGLSKHMSTHVPFHNVGTMAIRQIAVVG